MKSFSATLGWLALSATTLCMLTACPSSPKAPTSLAPEIKKNCETNLETAPADLKQCAAGAAGGCDSVRKDLKQVVQVHPSSQSGVDEVQAHLAACESKGDDSSDCKAAADAIGTLNCE